jgi:hypothetical protein
MSVSEGKAAIEIKYCANPRKRVRISLSKLSANSRSGSCRNLSQHIFRLASATDVSAKQTVNGHAPVEPPEFFGHTVGSQEITH